MVSRLVSLVRLMGLEPIRSPIRPSNVRVCLFRHNRIIQFLQFLTAWAIIPLLPPSVKPFFLQLSIYFLLVKLTNRCFRIIINRRKSIFGRSIK